MTVESMLAALRRLVPMTRPWRGSWLGFVPVMVPSYPGRAHQVGIIASRGSSGQ